MGECTVFVNGRGVAHAGSGGKSIAFPDLCNTPSPAGPVPMPYPNLAESAKVSDGPTSVKVDGSMPAVKGAKYSSSSGNEAGTNGGVMSGCTQGEAEFMNYSNDTRFDDRNVCRLADPLFQNKKNAMG